MTTDAQTRPDYLTVRELADLLRIKERKVYDLAGSGEVPCIKVTGKLLFPEAEIRAWIAGGRSAGKSSDARPSVFLGSHDPLLDWAIRQSRSGLATLFDGSLDGLARFKAGEGIATGLHLHDPASGEWNVPVMTADCAGENAVLVAWVTRRRGLVVRDGDAGAITGFADLPGRTVVPRQPESGSQRFLAQELETSGLSDRITWTAAAHSEGDAVLAVAQGAADAAFGLEALARPYGLHFVPIVEERFDLLVDRRAWFEPPMRRLMAFCATPEFHAHAKTLAGYDLSGFGEVRWNA